MATAGRLADLWVAPNHKLAAIRIRIQEFGCRATASEPLLDFPSAFLPSAFLVALNVSVVPHHLDVAGLPCVVGMQRVPT